MSRCWYLAALPAGLLAPWLAWAGQPARDATAETSAANARVCVVAAVGDSLSDPRSGGGKYLDVLRERCPKSRFVTHARGGSMVNQMRKHFESDLFGASTPSYTHVIVFGGVNDIGSNETAGRTVAAIRGDLAAMYDAARRRGVKVVALTIAPWGGFRAFHTAQRQQMTLEVNEWIRKSPAAGGADHVVDAYRLLSCEDPERLCESYVAPFNDGLHFNRRGHRKLGEALYRHVFWECR